ncbi:MAG: ammonium transporter [Proteobacteria bacterium]|nr:ammonium transporter [Pseudomonadota bacterium]
MTSQPSARHRPRRRLGALLPLSAGAAACLALLPSALAGGTDVMSLPEDTGATAWMLTATALVLLMVPGLAMFYGGLVRAKNVLGTMMHSFVAMAVIGVLWPVCGYALSFGTSHGGWIGWDSAKLLLGGIDDTWVPILKGTRRIPEYVFAMFQGKFAIITPALIAGAFAERVKLSGYVVFITLWSLLIYCPLAHIVWGGGFLTGEAIDLAGGTVIHISAGVAGLVAALFLGARQGHPRIAMHPNNLVMTMMGAGLLWVGWFGFNAGSQVSSGLATAQALTMTQIAAAAGALGWVLIEAVVHRKSTALGLVSGILAGLVAITPAAGDVRPLGAIALGLIASLCCYLAIQLKNRLGYDDTLDVFGIHGVAGIIGALGLSFFLRSTPAHGVATQLWYQTKGVLVSITVSVVVTLVLLVLVQKTIGLRMDAGDEMAGMDQSLHGERGYDLGAGS